MAVEVSPTFLTQVTVLDSTQERKQSRHETDETDETRPSSSMAGFRFEIWDVELKMYLTVQTGRGIV